MQLETKTITVDVIVNGEAKEVTALTVYYCTLVNLTKHAINIVWSPNQTIEVPPSGVDCLVKENYNPSYVDDVTCSATTTTYFGKVENLPDKQVGVVYLVGSLVFSALEAAGVYRDDLRRPDTNEYAVRNEKNQVVATRMLVAMNNPE